MITQDSKKVKLILTGGGTGGSVTPLLAMVEKLDDNKFEFLWLGTKKGPEKSLVEKFGIKFRPITNGKWRRYLSFKNIIDLFKIKLAFWQSLVILIKEKPDLVMSAGSFVSVPVIWAAWVLRIPVLIHQLDARPGLANKLMASFASIITVTFEKSLNDYGKKAIWAGSPVRNILTNLKMTRREAIQKLGFKEGKDVILVVGGGTGAVAINNLVKEGLKDMLNFTQIVHVVGQNEKNIEEFKKLEQENSGYRAFEFLDTTGMLKAFTASDVVISRCGMGVLTELSQLAKPSILIPIPNSHQEDNAKIFKDSEAAVVLNQKELDSEKLVAKTKELINNKELQNKLSNNINRIIKNFSGEEIRNIINKLIK